MQMSDRSNGTRTMLQVLEFTPGRYLVTDKVDSTTPWTVEVIADASGQLDVDAEVPELTTDELLDRYRMEDDEQLSFAPVEGCPCGELEQALIYFLVLEWFYFG